MGMKTYIDREKYESVLNRNSFNKKEVALLKHLNKHKKEFTEISHLLNYISRVLKIFNIPQDYTALYYKLWINNYREDGMYENVTHINIDDILEIDNTNPEYVGKRTYCKCILDKLPFVYDRWEGKWLTDGHGSSYYIVVHPYFQGGLYLFKNDTWYVVYDTKGLKCIPADCIRVGFLEMQKIVKEGGTYDDVLADRADVIISSSNQFLNKRIQKKIGGVKIIYKIESIVRNGHLLDFTVEIMPDSDIPTVDETLFKTILTKLYHRIHLRIEDSIGKIIIK
jgi:hypothetical protein